MSGVEVQVYGMEQATDVAVFMVDDPIESSDMECYRVKLTKVDTLPEPRLASAAKDWYVLIAMRNTENGWVWVTFDSEVRLEIYRTLKKMEAVEAWYWVGLSDISGRVH